MRFSYDSATETEESEAEPLQHGHNGLASDVKGKGRARELSKSASPRRSHSVRIRCVSGCSGLECAVHADLCPCITIIYSVPPVSSTRYTRELDDRSRIRASTSSDSSLSPNDDDDGLSDSGSDSDSDLDSAESGASYSGTDSEEDEFPVNPTSADLAQRR